jgi:hypothetical protein
MRSTGEDACLTDRVALSYMIAWRAMMRSALAVSMGDW